MSSNKLKLLAVYEETLIILKYQTKKYNLKTVKNLIFHFDDIEEDSKRLVYNEIYRYLFFIREIKMTDFGRQSKLESNELYNNFISPLIGFYLPLGFIVNFSWGILIFITIFAIPVFIILGLSFYYYIILYVIPLFLRVRSSFKEKQHKVYGTLY